MGDVYLPLTAEFAQAELTQQYLDRHKNGYCGLGGTGISCPVGVVKADG